MGTMNIQEFGLPRAILFAPMRSLVFLIFALLACAPLYPQGRAFTSGMQYRTDIRDTSSVNPSGKPGNSRQ